MNVCPVCRNQNDADATVCRYCQTALTPERKAAAYPAPPRRSNWPIFAGVVALVLVVSFGGASLIGGRGSAPAEAAAVPVEVTTGEGASLAFVPDTVTAPPDAPVALTFHNTSTLPHNLVFQDVITARTADSVAAGATEVLTFTSPGPGAYSFVCTIHPGMEGELTVQ